MRKAGLLTLFITGALAFLMTSPVFADRATTNLESRIIECFDNPDDPATYEWASSPWIIRGSKFKTEGWPQTKYIETWPEAVFGVNRDKKPLKVLGIWGRFDRQGYNNIEIIPAVDENGSLVPRHPAGLDAEGNLVQSNEIALPGRTKSIDFWVWGSNYDYYMQIHIRDFKGVVHVLDMGSIKHTGWKNLSVEIPSYIPQEGGYVTSGGYLKELTLVKVVLWTRPDENVNDFMVYIDQIKTLADVFVTRFDGDDLADETKIKEIWNGGK